MEDYGYATYALFATLDEARAGWYLGPVLAGGRLNQEIVALYIEYASK